AILVYAAFALMAVSVMGSDTTEIATIGLQQFLGKSVYIFGNIFAFLAMGTSFLITSLSFRDSLVWDFKVKDWVAIILVTLIPFLLFYFGIRSFVAVIDIIGGLFISLELFLIILIYWRAHTRGDLKYHTYPLHRIMVF